MFGRLRSGTLLGIEAQEIEVQVDVGGGLPSFQIVGLPDKEVSESRERIRSAIRNSGYSFPSGRITANLAPADLRKQGVGFDLPIALSILIASGQAAGPASAWMILGQLALDGAVQGLRGVLPLALEAAHAGLAGVVVPMENVSEAQLVRGLSVYSVATLREAVDTLHGAQPPVPVPSPANGEEAPAGVRAQHDLCEVRGQTAAKRALEIAAAGGHNLVLTGPPGAGKSMLARCMPEILPPLSLDEALDVTRIYSVVGLLPSGEALVRTRPFRSPHHTVSYAGMVGGGHGLPGPGEITLAHHGVLFLDELAEFDRRVLETLRQPLEEESVVLARAGVSVRYPASFTLVAAMNPCPCGHLGDEARPCTCTAHDIRRYRRHVSGPLLDRVDLFVDVPRLSADELLGRPEGESSALVRSRVVAARQRQWERASGGARCNARLGPEEARAVCGLDEEGRQLLRRAIARFALTGRGHARVLRVARTIADLEGARDIGAAHLAEALRYRNASPLRES
jgi:magnesium chelatase family protein